MISIVDAYQIVNKEKHLDYDLTKVAISTDFYLFTDTGDGWWGMINKETGEFSYFSLLNVMSLELLGEKTGYDKHFLEEIGRAISEARFLSDVLHQ